MKTLLYTAACWPSEEEARAKLWIFLKSCEKFGHQPALYGMGKGFSGYRDMLMERMLEYLKTVPSDYSHVLFTDSWDAMMTGTLDEIEWKYQQLGNPSMLVSAYFGLGNESDMAKYEGCFDQSLYYRYPNRGGFMGEREAVIDAFEKMMATEDGTGDDCFLWYRGWRECWLRPQLDSGCQIFQVTEEHCEVEGDRLYNIITKTQPCVLHLSGGYTDQVTGKDDRMVPWAKRLGVFCPPHEWARRRDGRRCVRCEFVEFGI